MRILHIAAAAALLLAGTSCQGIINDIDARLNPYKPLELSTKSAEFVDKGDDFTTFHINQAQVLNILGIVAGALTIFPLIGGIASTIVSAAVFVLWCIGIYRAITWSTEPLPLIGEIHLIG